MKRFLLLLLFFPLFAFAQTTTTITVFPSVGGLDSNGLQTLVIQNNLALVPSGAVDSPKLTSFYFYEWLPVDPTVGYDYTHVIVGSIGNPDWFSTVSTVPSPIYDVNGKVHNGVMGTLHAQWSGQDCSGVENPTTCIPGQFMVDATYTAYSQAGGSGRGAGYHFIVQWASMTVTITE